MVMLSCQIESAENAHELYPTFQLLFALEPIKKTTRRKYQSCILFHTEDLIRDPHLPVKKKPYAHLVSTAWSLGWDGTENSETPRRNGSTN